MSRLQTDKEGGARDRTMSRRAVGGPGRKWGTCCEGGPATTPGPASLSLDNREKRVKHLNRFYQPRPPTGPTTSANATVTVARTFLRVIVIILYHAGLSLRGLYNTAFQQWRVFST